MLDLNKMAYLVKYYLKAEIRGEKRPILGGIKITYKCNLTCPQCPYWRRNYNEAGFQRLIEAMDKMLAAGVRVLIIEGGEPLLWRDGDYTIDDLIFEAKQRFFTVGVTTNGTLPINLEADVVWVSIDGLEETHNRLRNNSFAKVMKNIKESKHSNVFANVTINKLNFQEIPDLVPYLAPLVKGITIQFFYPYEESEALLLDKQERIRALEHLIRLKQEGYPVVDSIDTLEALKENSWSCEAWMLCNGEPDGRLNFGCYLKNRTSERDPCQLCGFAAHTEISLAYQGSLGAIWAGRKILGIF